MIKDGIFARKRSEEGSIEHSGGCVEGFGGTKMEGRLKIGGEEDGERGAGEGEGREGV